MIALSLRLRLHPGRCEELQLSIQLACLCGGTGSAVEEGSLGASAVTNRSDTGCLWHQGRAGRGFSFTVQLPLHSLFGRYCGSPPGSGAPRRKLERSQASSRRAAGELPTGCCGFLCRGTPGLCCSPLHSPQGSHFQRETRFLSFSGACLCLAHPLATEEPVGASTLTHALWMSIPKLE